MYADDLVIVAEHREELQGALQEWNDMFKKHGLNMNLDNTEVMGVGKYRERGVKHQAGREIHLYIKQVKTCVYIWVEIYLRTGEWRWRYDEEYKQERMHGET